MSYKVLIADDEPLVLIGLRDMIDWASEGFEIVGQARNGKALLDEIEDKECDLVVTDIKMPLMSGIEVLEEVHRRGKSLPLFIFLTSFEEFDLIKKAMSLEAVDYIVKLELDARQLTEALERSARRIDELKGGSVRTRDAGERKLLQDRYLTRLLFSMEGGIEAKDIGLDIEDYDAWTAALVTMPSISSGKDAEKALPLHSGACRLIEDTASRYTRVHIVQLDLGHIAVIFPFRKEAMAGYRSYVHSAFKAGLEGLHDYFSLEAYAYVGPLVEDIRLLSDSFAKAKVLSREKGQGNAHIVFHDHSAEPVGGETRLDSALFTKAFSELSAELLDQGIDEIVAQIDSGRLGRVQAIDLASSILYLAQGLVPDAESCLRQIFPAEENIHSYRSLYQAYNPSEVAHWLTRFRDGFARLFSEKRQDYRMQTVQRIQAYIDENVSKKLSLGAVASIFGYSQNYLSSLFSRYASMSFVDYVNKAKIEKAKLLLADPNALVYEVATSLGFESPFYFSKVFKRVTGISPTTYQNNLRNSKGENP